MDWQLFPSDKIKDLDIDFIVHAIHAEFGKKRIFNRQSLIIFDNAQNGFLEESFKGNFPQNTNILITSRDKNWQQLMLDLSHPDYQLTQAEGIEILRKWIGKERFDQQEAKDIVERFNQLPVVIAQAGSYLAKSKTLKMKQYLELFDAKKLEILDKGKVKGRKDIDVVVSIRMIMKQLEPSTSKLLKYCACLPSKNIPVSLLQKVMNVDLNTITDHLSNLNVLITPTDQCVSIHTLFQEIILEEIGEEKEAVLVHLAECSNMYKNFIATQSDKAIAIYQAGIGSNEKRQDTEAQLKVAAYSINLGELYYPLGNYAKGLFYAEKALKIRQELLGSTHTETAEAYNDTGAFLGRHGQHDKALEYKRKALEIRLKAYGKMDYRVANSYANTGYTLGQLGSERYVEALDYLQKSLEIRLQIDDPNVAGSYHNVGDILRKMDRNEEALKHFQIAVDIWKKNLGENHPKIARSYSHMAKILGKLNRAEEGLKKIDAALLIIQKNLFPTDNSSLTNGYYIKGNLEDQLKEHGKALVSRENALKASKKFLGENHLNTADCYEDMAKTLEYLNRKEEALKCRQKADAIRSARI